jgi:hypothetical protein
MNKALKAMQHEIFEDVIKKMYFEAKEIFIVIITVRSI